MKNIEKIFGTVAATLYVALYFFLTIKSGHLQVLTAFIHSPFLIASALVVSAALTPYSWVNKAFFLVFASLSTIVNGLCMYIFYNLLDWNKHYMPFITEVLTLIIFILMGVAIGAVATLPMKFIQMFFYDTPLYEDEKAVESKKRSIADRYKAILSGMNETELNIELRNLIDNEEFEKASIVREELKRFR